jgi:nitrite reductase/ring-hydroxylating ferredoxin subunit
MRYAPMAEPTEANESEFDLCSLEELQAKNAMRFEFFHPKQGHHEIGLFWDGEEAYAIDNYCPHEYAMLTFGFIEPRVIICPLHAAVFDLKTGECLDKYTYNVVPYEAEVRDGRVWVKAPGEQRPVSDK